ncbi:hypothetical protein FOA52_014793 [Chlamydomonas sp. UWO 241]|nr:hypothetical protein FOA52_014793 [Chlamydomonas sp. UWO 241]
MELTCLGQGSSPCALLRFRHTNVLLDCALDTASVLHVQPRHGGSPAPSGGGGGGPSTTEPLPVLGPLLQLARLERIHAVLVSSPEGLLGVPALLTGHPDAEYVRVYATLAAIDVARHMAAELADTDSRLALAPVVVGGGSEQEQAGDAAGAGPGSRGSGGAGAWDLPPRESLGWQLPPGYPDEAYAACWWRRGFSAAAVESVLARVTPVRYGQSVSLDGTYVSAVAFPSGGCMGGALWVVSDGTRSIGYASRLGVSEQQRWWTELQADALSGLHALILAPGAVTGAQQAAAAGKAPTPSLAEAVAQAQATLREGGSVVLPVTASGAQWPVLEALFQAFHQQQQEQQQQRKQQQLGQQQQQMPPVLYVGAASQDSLAFACTCPEFVSRFRHDLVFQAVAPFAFDQLIAHGQLSVADSLADRDLQHRWREPAVVLVPTPSLHAGPGAQLLAKWGRDARSLLLLPVEPHTYGGATSVGAAAALLARHSAPHAGGMRVSVYQPAVPVPHAHELARLLDDAQPSHLVAWHEDCAALIGAPPPPGVPMRACMWRQRCVPYGWLGRVDVGLPHASLPECSLPAADAARLEWSPVDGQLSLLAARFSGALVLRNSAWHLEADKPSVGGKGGSGGGSGGGARSAVESSRAALTWGHPTLSGLLRQLQMRGFEWLDVDVEEGQKEQAQRGPRGDVPLEEVTVVRVGGGAGEIRIGDAWATISAVDAGVRQALHDCLQHQLRTL